MSPDDETNATVNAMRSQIDDYDKAIISLINQRRKISRQVQEYKADRHMPIVDHSRETTIIHYYAEQLGSYTGTEMGKLILRHSHV